MIPILYGTITAVYGDDNAVYVGENGEVYSDEISRVDFNTLGIGPLSEAISCNVKTVLNGQFELEMQYPVSGIRYEDLRVSNIIGAVSEKNGTQQLFDIYAITKPMNGIVTVYASHVSGRKQFIPIMPCLATSAAEAFQVIASHTAEPNPFTFWTDKNTVANFILKAPASLGQVLGGMEGSILDTYRGEYEFDNWTIKFWNRRGQDNGVTLRYGKNITNIEQEESIASTVTGICPFWSDMNGNSITLPENVIESAKAANFPFRRTIVKDFSAYFDEQPTEAQLRAVAQAYVAQESIGVPVVGMDVSYENLADYEEFADVALLEQVRLGDTVRVYFEPLEITAEARVTETVFDVLADKYKRIRVGTIKTSLSSVINTNAEEAKANTVNTSSKLEAAFNEAITLLSGADGGNIIIRRNAVTGKPYELLAMDTDDINTAQNVVRLNSAGIGVSTNGINGPYTIAGTGAGLVATAITTGTLNATLIKAGILSSENGDFSLNMETGTANLANANITGGSINIETAVETTDKVILRSAKAYTGIAPNGFYVVNTDQAADPYRQTIMFGNAFQLKNTQTGQNLVWIGSIATENGIGFIRLYKNGDTIVYIGSISGTHEGMVQVLNRYKKAAATLACDTNNGSGIVNLRSSTDTLRTQLSVDGLKFFDASGNEIGNYKSNHKVLTGVGNVLSVTAQSYKDTTITFSSAFSSTPFVIVLLNSSSVGYAPALLALSTTSISTTGFTFRAYNGNTSVQSIPYKWIAFTT